MDELQPYLAHLKDLPGVRSARAKKAPAALKEVGDAVVVLQTESGTQELLADVRRTHLSQALATRIIEGARRQMRQTGMPLLMLAPSVGAPLGKELAAGGVNFLDRQGNCHLQLKGVLMHVEGRSAPKVAATDKGMRAAGYQVLFAYLADPTLLDRTVRDVAQAAGVSRQAASQLRRRLVQDDDILDASSGARWRPKRREAALVRWLEGYRAVVRPRLLIGTYQTPDKSPAELETRLAPLLEKHAGTWRWGGTAGGYRLLRHYRGERTVVHVSRRPATVEQTFRALRRTEGNLVLLEAFGEVCWPAGQSTVHPLLVYSEMVMGNSDRSREAAELLFHEHIQPQWDSP